jgi:hypothetical protein
MEGTTMKECVTCGEMVNPATDGRYCVACLVGELNELLEALEGAEYTGYNDAITSAITWMINRRDVIPCK